MNFSVSRAKYTSWIFGMMALSLLAIIQSAKATDDRSSALILADAVEHNRALTRSEYLSALVSSAPFDPALLVHAMASQDARVRRVAALQFGELPSAQLTAQFTELLVQAVRDSDQGVAEQALASLIRLGGRTPAVLLPLIRQTSPLRDFRYDSARANRTLSLGITASDLAIAGLYYGSDVDLDSLVDAYSDAIRREAAAAEIHAADNQFHVLVPRNFSVEPGSSAYFANALAALLRRSPDAHAELINRLFDSEDQRLRSIAYDSATRVTAKEPLTARLAAVVRNSAIAEDRALAADALLAQGSAGRDSLVQLALDGNPAVRSAALPPLLDDIDCSSPFLARVLVDPDRSVRITALKSMFGFGRGYRGARYIPCLTPLVVDSGIDIELRQSIVSALDPGNNKKSRSTISIGDVEDLFRILRPVLSDPQSELYESGWRLVSDLLEGRETLETGIAEIARDRLTSGLTSKDEYVVCALRSVAPKMIAADLSLMSSLVNALESPRDSNVRDCVEDALSNFDFKLPVLSPLSESILSAFRRQDYLTDKELALIETSIPADLFAQDWRELAVSKSGESRLEVYRIAASRGLATEEAVTLFSDVLAAKTDGLGGKPNRREYDLQYDLRYRDMPVAVRGLVAAGNRGREELGKVLRGERGSGLGRSVVALELTKLDRQATLSLRPALIAAVGDKDPEVRSLVAYALPRLMDGEVLVGAIRPLFTDSDQNVLFQIFDLIMKSGTRIPGLLESISASDEQIIVESISRHSYPYLRADAPSLLVKFHDRLPPAFVTSILKQLLLDPDRGPRGAAMRAVGDLGPLGVSALEDALADENVSRLFDQLASGIPRLGPAERRKLQPTLVELLKRYPDSAPLLEAVGVVADNDSSVVLTIEEALLSDREELSRSALKALSAKRFFSSSSQVYLAALIDQQIGTYLHSYLGNVLEIIRPYYGNVPLSSRSRQLPEFPWPPPTWSFKEVVPKNLIGDDNASFGQVSDRLAAAIRAASPNFDYGFFGVPDGFLMLARLERINPDGEPFPGRLRWDSNPILPRSLNEYLIDLFLSPPGYFRVIAFAVTGDEPTTTQTDAKLPSPSEGAKTLPDEMAKQPLAGHQVFALIYTFKRYDGAKMVLNYEGSPSGLTHLVASGIWSALQIPPPGGR